jgi:hypothetical protein
MTKPFWRTIDIVRVNGAPPLGFWNLVVDWVSGPRLLRFKISNVDGAGAKVDQTWGMAKDQQPCTANGMTEKDAGPPFPCKGANPGALIAKIGGSVADLASSKLDDASPYPGRKVFPVGELCVIQISKDEGGPLFLGMNDEPKHSSEHVGELYVLIEEAAI